MVPGLFERERQAGEQRRGALLATVAGQRAPPGPEAARPDAAATPKLERSPPRYRAAPFRLLSLAVIPRRHPR